MTLKVINLRFITADEQGVSHIHPYTPSTTLVLTGDSFFLPATEIRDHQTDEKEDLILNLPDVPSVSPGREKKETRTALTS